MGKGLLGLVTLLAALMLVSACGDKDEGKASDLILAGAEVIGSIQIADVLNDENLERLFQTLPEVFEDGLTLRDLLAEVEAETGVAPADLDNILFFAELSGEDRFAIILRGAFDRDKVEAVFQKEAGDAFIARDYKDLQIMEDEERENSVAFLDESTLVGGNSASVRSVIDVRAGDAPSLSGAVMDTFEDLDDALVRVSIALPDEAHNDVGEIPLDLPFDLNLSIFQEISTVGITLGEEGDDYVVEVRLDFASEASAESASDVIEGAVLILKGLSQGESVDGLLERVTAELQGSSLSIAARATISQLEDLAGSLGELDGLPDLDFDLFGLGQTE